MMEISGSAIDLYGKKRRKKLGERNDGCVFVCVCFFYTGGDDAALEPNYTHICIFMTQGTFVNEIARVRLTKLDDVSTDGFFSARWPHSSRRNCPAVPLPIGRMKKKPIGMPYYVYVIKNTWMSMNSFLLRSSPFYYLTCDSLWRYLMKMFVLSRDLEITLFLFHHSILVPVSK